MFLFDNDKGALFDTDVMALNGLSLAMCILFIYALYACVCMCVCMYVCMYVCISMCVCVFKAVMRYPLWPNGYDAWLPSASLQVLDPKWAWPGRNIDVRRCEGLSMVLLHLKIPLKLFVRKGDLFSVLGFYLIAI